MKIIPATVSLPSAVYRLYQIRIVSSKRVQVLNRISGTFYAGKDRDISLLTTILPTI